MRSRSLALCLAVLAALAPVRAQAQATAVTPEMKKASTELVGAAHAAVRSAFLTSNPLNNNDDNAGYFLTNACQNFWFESRQMDYFIQNKRPNVNLAIKRFERLKLIQAKIEKILDPPPAVVLEGLPAKKHCYAHVKKVWERVKAAMTKLEGLLSGGSPAPAPPSPAPPSPDPSPAPPSPAPPTPDPSPTSAPPSPAPSPTSAPSGPPVPSPSH